MIHMASPHRTEGFERTRCKPFGDCSKGAPLRCRDDLALTGDTRQQRIDFGYREIDDDDFVERVPLHSEASCQLRLMMNSQLTGLSRPRIINRLVEQFCHYYLYEN